MTRPTTGPLSVKRYRCTHCDHERLVSTNHWGEIYSACPECSWRRPMDPAVSVCIEPVPDGYDTPEPWRIVRLGDVATVRYSTRRLCDGYDVAAIAPDGKVLAVNARILTHGYALSLARRWAAEYFLPVVDHTTSQQDMLNAREDWQAEVYRMND